MSSEWAERALGNRDHPLIRDRGETYGPMGGQDGGQGPIRAGQCDLHTLGLGLAMMENHDPPLGKEQLDIRSQEPRQNSARIEI